ncbi:MAG: DHA2 family efflux MFS transporter permease subunit [Acidimicrobiales bacterium]|nr:DHA2 family efflux MFS transporter permease subunit [Acidimicrobiales bacterium]
MFYQRVLSLSSRGAHVATVPSPLADRFGRRRAFLGAVVVFTVASMLCGLAPGPALLVVARVLQAVGAAALVPASLALVLQSFPRERIPAAVAIWGAIGAVAGAAGPTLGALVVENLDWRWAFFVNLPVGMVSFALGSKVLPEGRERNPGPLPDPFGVVLLVAGMSLAAFAIVRTERWGWLDPRPASTMVVAIALLGAFVWRCATVAHPLLDLELFRAPAFRWANLATVLFAVGFNAMFLGNVLFLTQVWGYSILRAGGAIAVGPSIVAVTAPFLGRLAGRVGQRTLLIPGGMIWAAGGLHLLVRATTQPHYLAHFLPTTCLTALGVAFILPQLSSVAVQGLPPDRFGAGSAVTQSMRNLGGTLGVSLVVAITAAAAASASDDPLNAFHRVWLLVASCGAAVTLLRIRLPRRNAAIHSTALPRSAPPSAPAATPDPVIKEVPA